MPATDDADADDGLRPQRCAGGGGDGGRARTDGDQAEGEVDREDLHADGNEGRDHPQQRR